MTFCITDGKIRSEREGERGRGGMGKSERGGEGHKLRVFVVSLPGSSYTLQDKVPTDKVSQDKNPQIMQIMDHVLCDFLLDFLLPN